MLWNQWKPRCGNYHCIKKCCDDNQPYRFLNTCTASGVVVSGSINASYNITTTKNTNFPVVIQTGQKGSFQKRYLAQKPYPTSCMNSARELSMMVFANSPESGRILSMGMSRFSGYSSGASTTGQRSWGKSETNGKPLEDWKCVCLFFKMV